MQVLRSLSHLYFNLYKHLREKAECSTVLTTCHAYLLFLSENLTGKETHSVETIGGNASSALPHQQHLTKFLYVGQC